MDASTLEQIIQATGGGFTGMAVLLIFLFVTGRLPTPAERAMYQAEIDKRDKLLEQKDAYIQKQTQEMQALNEAVRGDTIPALEAVLRLFIQRGGLDGQASPKP